MAFGTRYIVHRHSHNVGVVVKTTGTTCVVVGVTGT